MYINRLYKYIHFDGNLDSSIQHDRKKSFENGEIWYSKAINLNDPYDCRPIITIDNEQIPEIIKNLSNDEIRYLGTKIKFDTIEELLQKIITPQKIKYIDRTENQYFIRFFFKSYIYQFQLAKIANVGVLSLSEDNRNILMWTHYAKNHSGICLGIERNKKNLLGSIKTRKIRYLKHRPRVSLLETMHEKYGKLEEMLFRKSRHWMHEKEWRNCKAEGNKTYQYPGQLIEIIYGVNFPPKNYQLIQDIFGNKVKYFKAILGDNFEIIIKNLNE
jgi:hypothetical protein